MAGIAIASCAHFFARLIFSYIIVHLDTDLSKCLIPYSHEDSWKDLREMINIGYQSLLLKVMGCWAFDVFT